MSLDWSKYPNFAESEFVCKCGCGRADMDADFMAWLQKVRTIFGKPLIVNSGFRCPDYNARISTTGRDGPHTTGKAADLRVVRRDAHRFAQIAFNEEVSGIGFKQHGPWDRRFIHVDLLPGGNSRPTVWTY